MEYTIYDESLVYYTLRNTNTGKYFCGSYKKAGKLGECSVFNNKRLAKQYLQNNPEYDEIRKIKVVDIGSL